MLLTYGVLESISGYIQHEDHSIRAVVYFILWNLTSGTAIQTKSVINHSIFATAINNLAIEPNADARLELGELLSSIAVNLQGNDDILDCLKTPICQNLAKIMSIDNTPKFLVLCF
jgi:hypothetical protein